MKPSYSRSSTNNLTVRDLIAIYWRQYIALFILIIILGISETLTPYRHVLYSGSDNEIWKYSYPLRVNRVPAWAVPTISILAPCLSILAAYLTGGISLFEAHQAAMAAVTGVVTTGLITNFTKVHVARFRPNFVARCWPNGATIAYDADGRPACTSDAVDPAEGMKSFPSGHTSWSTSGLGFLSFWLMGKLRCFSSNSKFGPLGLIVALSPLTGSIYIGASRLIDYWHHVEDVATGFALGLTMSYMFYRTAYAGIMTEQAGSLTSNTASNTSNNNDTGGLLLGSYEDSKV